LRENEVERTWKAAIGETELQSRQRIQSPVLTQGASDSSALDSQQIEFHFCVHGTPRDRGRWGRRRNELGNISDACFAIVKI